MKKIIATLLLTSFALPLIGITGVANAQETQVSTVVPSFSAIQRVEITPEETIEKYIPIPIPEPIPELRDVELILKKTYDRGETITVQVKNNLNRSMYYLESGCSFDYEIYAVYENTAREVNTVNPCVMGPCNIGKGVEISPGETVTLNYPWNQLEFPSICTAPFKVQGSQIPCGRYSATFRYSLSNFTSKPEFKSISRFFNIICAAEEVVSCPINCKCDSKGNVIECWGPTVSCPKGCICKGNLIACPTETEGSFIAPIVTESGTTNVIIEKTEEEKLSIKTVTPSAEGVSESISALTSEKLIVDKSKLYVDTSEGEKQVKIMPEEAISKMEEETGIERLDIKEEEIKLEVEKSALVYSIKGKKRAKLFFIIPVSMEVETKVSAETGNVVSVKKPWWSFLAW